MHSSAILPAFHLPGGVELVDVLDHLRGEQRVAGPCPASRQDHQEAEEDQGTHPELREEVVCVGEEEEEKVGIVREMKRERERKIEREKSRWQ